MGKCMSKKANTDFLGTEGQSQAPLKHGAALKDASTVNEGESSSRP